MLRMVYITHISLSQNIVVKILHTTNKRNSYQYMVAYYANNVVYYANSVKLTIVRVSDETKRVYTKE